MRNADGSFDLDANGFPKLDTTGDKVIGDQIRTGLELQE
jgi:hypothetical protein